jgi:aspartate oxidase
MGMPIVSILRITRRRAAQALHQRIPAEDPYKQPMRIYPAIPYTMGGLRVDYILMSSMSGLYALGEANYSDHGVNRLGASASMQGLADLTLQGPHGDTAKNVLRTTEELRIDEMLDEDSKDSVPASDPPVCILRGLERRSK